MPCSNGISPLYAPHLTRHAMRSCRPPPGVNLASPWARIVHNGFGSYKCGSGIFIPCTSQCCVLSLSLRLSARHAYTLPGSCFKKKGKTLLRASSHSRFQHSFDAHHSFRALPACHHLVSDLFNPTRVGSFQLSLALLVLYRSIANI